MNKVILLSNLVLISLGYITSSVDKCYNVTCSSLTDDICVSTSSSDLSMKLNTVFCNNGNSLQITPR